MVAAPQQQKQQSRMSLSNVVHGKQKSPEKVTLYGPEGVGKSTFGAGWPKPIFLAAEDGTKHLDVSRLPSPESWLDVLAGIQALINDKHDYKTLVIDTADWVEPLIWDYICQRDNKANIEDYGYAKGYQVAVDVWRTLMAELERLRHTKAMHVVILAHSFVKTFKNPEGEDYDRYEMKVHAKGAGIIKEWSDHVLFANHELASKKDQRTKRVRGVTTNVRWLYTTRTAAFDAKHRGVLPDVLALSCGDFLQALKDQQLADPKVLLEEIQRKAKELGGDLERLTLETIPKLGGDAAKLAQLNNRLNAKLAEREAEKTGQSSEQPAAQ